jgi:hypothetical protein
MIRKQIQKRQKIKSLIWPIAVGMIHLATNFAAATFAAAVSYAGGFSEIEYFQRFVYVISLERNGDLDTSTEPVSARAARLCSGP